MKILTSLFEYIMDKPILAIPLIALILYWLFSSDETDKNIADLPLQPEHFGRYVLDWCQSNIFINEPIQTKLQIIKGRNPKDNRIGEYDPNTDKIRVFLGRIKSIKDFTNTVIHEYAHAVQFSKDQLTYYEHYEKEYGYSKNPYEKEACAVASKYTEQCLKDLAYLYS